jgi:hypothetical protein
MDAFSGETMALHDEKIPLYVPTLDGLYAAVKPYSYPLLRIAMVCFMAMAFFVANAVNGWFWTKGGMEAPGIWGLTCLVILINGGGRLSLDRAIGKEI